MPNFVFIAAGRQLTELGYRFRETLAFPASFTVVETKMENAVDYCQHRLPSGTDAIIARGNTARMLKSARIPVPVVTMPLKDSDLIRSITAACALYPEKESRIAYIGLEDTIRSVGEFLKTIHKEIRFFRIEDSRDIQNCIRQAKQEQIQVVIGGEYTKELAEAQGLHCVLLESTESSLREAYERAMEIQKGILIQKKKLQEKLILMNAISDVIIGINEKGRISLFNQAAETLFSRKEAQTIGKAASTLFSEEELAIVNRVLLRGDEVLAHPIILFSDEWLMDFRPVIIHGQSKGIIIRIHPGSQRSSGYPQNTEHVSTSGRASAVPGSSLGAAPVSVPETAPGSVPCTASCSLSRSDIRSGSGQSPAMLPACALSARFAASALPVLITGESGTGKTSFAHWIHLQSPRKSGIFLVREAPLLTAEDIMAANGGSLCIHDIDTLPFSMVPVLNQLLERGVLGMPDQSFRSLSVRIFATFSGNIHELSDRLESRLYYNLNALTLKIPALKERTEDIWLLFSSMLEQICRSRPDTAIPNLPGTAAEKLLSSFSWPGNIRQLRSVAQRFSLLAPESGSSTAAAETNLACLRQCLEQEFDFSMQSQPENIVNTTKNAPADFSAGALFSDKNFVIHGRLVSWEELKALDQYYQGHRSLLAKQLGVSRSTLWRYFKEMAADRP